MRSSRLARGREVVGCTPAFPPRLVVGSDPPEALLQRGEDALLDAGAEPCAQVLEALLDVPLHRLGRRPRWRRGDRPLRGFDALDLELVDPLRLVEPAQVPLAEGE